MALISGHALRTTHRGMQRAALDGVDVCVDAGDVVAVIGHNGAGKSTLVDIVCGLIRPDGGSVTRTVAGPDVGWCPQREIIDWSLTVRQNIRLGLEIRTGRRVAPSALDDVLGPLDLADHADRQAETLSRDFMAQAGESDDLWSAYRHHVRGAAGAGAA